MKKLFFATIVITLTIIAAGSVYATTNIQPAATTEQFQNTVITSELQPAATAQELQPANYNPQAQ